MQYQGVMKDTSIEIWIQSLLVLANGAYVLFLPVVCLPMTSSLLIQLWLC